MPQEDFTPIHSTYEGKPINPIDEADFMDVAAKKVQIEVYASPRIDVEFYTEYSEELNLKLARYKDWDKSDNFSTNKRRIKVYYPPNDPQFTLDFAKSIQSLLKENGYQVSLLVQRKAGEAFLPPESVNPDTPEEVGYTFLKPDTEYSILYGYSSVPATLRFQEVKVPNFGEVLFVFQLFLRTSNTPPAYHLFPDMISHFSTNQRILLDSEGLKLFFNLKVSPQQE